MAARSYRVGLIYVLCALIGLLIATVTSGPARLLAGPLARASDGHVQLAATGGTWWSGSTDLIISTAQGRLQLTGLTWQLDATHLWRGELTITVVSNAPELSGTIGAQLGLDGLRLRSTDLHASVQLLANQIPALGAIGPQGALQLQTDTLALTAGRLSGAATLRIANTRSARLGDMGDYQIDMTGAGDSVAIALGTIRGPVRLSGNGQCSLGGVFQFRGEARAEGPDSARLSSILSSFGMPRADGSVQLAWPIGSGAAHDG